MLTTAGGWLRPDGTSPVCAIIPPLVQVRGAASRQIASIQNPSFLVRLRETPSTANVCPLNQIHVLAL